MIGSIRLLRRSLADQRLGFGILVRAIGLFEPFKQCRNEGGFMRVMDEFQSVEQLRWLPDRWTREASGLQLSMLARVSSVHLCFVVKGIDSI